jgi:hypothetical protein
VVVDGYGGGQLEFMLHDGLGNRSRWPLASEVSLGYYERTTEGVEKFQPEVPDTQQ